MCTQTELLHLLQANCLRIFLLRVIACSRTSVYNARGNGQYERYNGIIWTAVKLALKSRNLDSPQWELVLPDALHSIRSLLCIAANQTPHERFFKLSTEIIIWYFCTHLTGWSRASFFEVASSHQQVWPSSRPSKIWACNAKLRSCTYSPAAGERLLYRYVTLLRVTLLTSHHLFVMTILHPLTLMRTLQ